MTQRNHSALESLGKLSRKIKLKLRLIVKWNEKISHTLCNGSDILRGKFVRQNKQFVQNTYSDSQTLTHRLL